MSVLRFRGLVLTTGLFDGQVPASHRRSVEERPGDLRICGSSDCTASCKDVVALRRILTTLTDLSTGSTLSIHFMLFLKCLSRPPARASRYYLRPVASFDHWRLLSDDDVFEYTKYEHICLNWYACLVMLIRCRKA